jgi:hypothetical protein
MFGREKEEEGSFTLRREVAKGEKGELGGGGGWRRILGKEKGSWKEKRNGKGRFGRGCVWLWIGEIRC